MKSPLSTQRIIPVLGLFVLLLTTACGGGGEQKPVLPPPPNPSDIHADASAAAKKPMISNVELGPRDAAKAQAGKALYELKCQSCHSLGENRIVGPGWKGIIPRREPAWILNMILNTDAMLASDPVAQKQLEECLVRMPNQGLSEDEARTVLEFMRAL